MWTKEEPIICITAFQRQRQRRRDCHIREKKGGPCTRLQLGHGPDFCNCLPSQEKYWQKMSAAKQLFLDKRAVSTVTLGARAYLPNGDRNIGRRRALRCSKAAEQRKPGNNKQPSYHYCHYKEIRAANKKKKMSTVINFFRIWRN